MIIGLTGPAGCGKSTVASWLHCRHSYLQMSFADKLKQMLSYVGIDEPDREFKESILPGYSFSYREAAQKLGTEWGRSLDPDLWVKFLDNDFKTKYKGATNIVIADVRFENEAKYVRENGFLVHISGRKSDLGGNASHVSEAGISRMLVDFFIENVDKLEHLHSKVDVLVKLIDENYTQLSEAQ